MGGFMSLMICFTFPVADYPTASNISSMPKYPNSTEIFVVCTPPGSEQPMVIVDISSTNDKHSAMQVGAPNGYCDRENNEKPWTCAMRHFKNFTGISISQLNIINIKYVPSVHTEQSTAAYDPDQARFKVTLHPSTCAGDGLWNCKTNSNLITPWNSSQVLKKESQVTGSSFCDQESWHTTFVDDFSVDGNLENWVVADRPYQGGNKLMPEKDGPKFYELRAASGSAENVKVADGYLKLISKKEPGGHYSSGAVDSGVKFSVTGPSRVCVRGKLPTGQGMWPAYWLNGPNWPTGGEIDIMEMINGDGNLYGTYHWGSNSNDDNQIQGSKSVEDFDTAFHEYAVGKRIMYDIMCDTMVEFDDEKIVFYLDSQPYKTIKKGDRSNKGRQVELHPYSEYTMILNSAIGGGGVWARSPDPANWKDQEHLIDYVKVSKQTAGVTAAAPSSTNATFFDGLRKATIDGNFRWVTEIDVGRLSQLQNQKQSGDDQGDQLCNGYLFNPEQAEMIL